MCSELNNITVSSRWSLTSFLCPPELAGLMGCHLIAETGQARLGFGDLLFERALLHKSPCAAVFARQDACLCWPPRWSIMPYDLHRSLPLHFGKSRAQGRVAAR